jgi:hypothetical protein
MRKERRGTAAAGEKIVATIIEGGTIILLFSKVESDVRGSIHLERLVKNQ